MGRSELCTWYNGELSTSSAPFLVAEGFDKPNLDFPADFSTLTAFPLPDFPLFLRASLDASRVGLPFDGGAALAAFCGGGATAGSSPRAFSNKGTIVFLETGLSFSVARLIGSNPVCFMIGKIQSWAGLRTSADLNRKIILKELYVYVSKTIISSINIMSIVGKKKSRYI